MHQVRHLLNLLKSINLLIQIQRYVSTILRHSKLPVLE